MPIYVYEPTVFSTEEEVHDCCFFEILQPMSASPLTHCPTCNHAIHRAVTTFHLGNNALADKNHPLANQPPSSAQKAARMAMKHVCGQGCSH
jgi:hypothetical protein